jgi:hypothetical protein
MQRSHRRFRSVSEFDARIGRLENLKVGKHRDLAATPPSGGGIGTSFLPNPQAHNCRLRMIRWIIHDESDWESCSPYKTCFDFTDRAQAY